MRTDVFNKTYIFCIAIKEKYYKQYFILLSISKHKLKIIPLESSLNIRSIPFH